MKVSDNVTTVPLTDEQRLFFDTQGYLVLEDVLEGDGLTRVQEEFYRVEDETKGEWKQAVEEDLDFKPYGIGPTAHVVYPIITHGDVFLDLLEHPRTISIAESFMGPDIQMIDNALHVKFAGTKAHTAWHKDAKAWFYPLEKWGGEDRKRWEQIRACETPFLKIKIFFFVEDVDEETAPFSVVPGSHKLDVDEVPQYDPLTDMPNHIKLVGRAGSAILWNANIWHTAMDSVDTKARRMLLFNYVHFGIKQHGPCVPSEAFAEYVKKRSPLCRQLLGLERMSRS